MEHGALGLEIVGRLAMTLPAHAATEDLYSAGLVGLLNARHLLYSASLAPWFAGTSRRVRAACAYVLADETYALAMPAIRSCMSGA